MRRRLLNTLGLIVLAVIASGAGPARAQTVAPGPYYATPAWDQTLACTTLAACPRFIVLSNMNNDAVLDRETGLVWERSPASNLTTWPAAHARCTNIVTIGNRKGWRLPSLDELGSLIDTTQANPALPGGHPFANPQLDRGYWSGTTAVGDPDSALALNFTNGGVIAANKISLLVTQHVWCVRGGQGVDPH